jgi:two-component system nitrogen regulation sensor histidine kinase NtrY
MGTAAARRRAFVIALGVCLLLLFLALGTLNAFNLNFLNPASPLQTLVFLALSVLAFLLFVGVLVLLVRNVLKLYADQRSRVLGTRLRTRMLWGAVLVSIVPLVFMFAFSYLLMNRAVERWFSQPGTQMRDDSNRLISDLTHYVDSNARAEADSIALGVTTATPASAKPPADTLNRELHRHDVTLQGGFAIAYQNGKPVAAIDVPHGSAAAQLKPVQPPDNASDESPDYSSTPAAANTIALPGPALAAIFIAAQRKDGSLYSFGGIDYTLATAALKSGGLIVVGLPIPAGISSTAAHLRASADAYWTLSRERRQIRNLYMFLLLLTTSLALFACCWLALNLSKQVTRPIESLADAMEAIAAGDYAHRVGQSATEELGELVDRFNAMAADLDAAHTKAEQSSAQLIQLNATLQHRRTELETIIETIPNGVVTLSADRYIVVSNRAFSEMLDPGGQKQFVGLALDAVLPPDIVDTLDRLLRRAHRMGSASDDMEMQSATGILHLSATVALLEDDTARIAGGESRRHLGYVLVMENATELLRAQKQSAWKEVARRVAHEIKNPLTPISLNAELINRHVGRLSTLLTEHSIDSPSPAVIQRSSAVISSAVETMRALVDQFSALAEFPSARPRPADLNAIVETALALFAGRLGNISVVRDLAPNLPLVMADPEALKRALSNLIDNAAEAMQHSLLRELHIRSRSVGPATVELTIADTGPGLTDDMRDRLFLPYFSTKQRGTGLGLAIAAKILQEHQGSIRAEKNVPAGARFIVELRAVAGADDANESPTETPTATISEKQGVAA